MVHAKKESIIHALILQFTLLMPIFMLILYIGTIAEMDMARVRKPSSKTV
jgi:hypothetical protein